jgi:uncharacterized membrane protein YgcG
VLAPPAATMLPLPLLLLALPVVATGLHTPRCSQPQPPGASSFRTGDLVFVRPTLDAHHSSLDAGILATGAATIEWLRAQGVPVPGNETATHVALAHVNSSTGCLSFVQALPPVVIETPALEFWHSTLPSTTTFYRAWFRDGALQSQLADAALAAATSQLGKPYAHDFEPPPSEFYCSSLVMWSFRTAASGRRVFFPPSLPEFTLLFEPPSFWKQYYKELGIPLPVNVTGSNPTLLLHSPALSFEVVRDDVAERASSGSGGGSGSGSGSGRSGGSGGDGDTGTGSGITSEEVTWSGFNWTVKDSNGGKAGPGPNVFSASNVAVDQETDQLHLSIKPINGSSSLPSSTAVVEWSSAEILLPSDSAMGFGRYRWVLETPLSALGDRCKNGLFEPFYI